MADLTVSVASRTVRNRWRPFTCVCFDLKGAAAIALDPEQLGSGRTTLTRPRFRFYFSKTSFKA
jgi:hypothetical protein